MATRSWLELMGMVHYADTFEDTGKTIECVYNIAIANDEEDCSSLFRLNLLGRRVNFSDTECQRLFHYSQAYYYEGGKQKYFADLEPMRISLKRRSLQRGGGFHPVSFEAGEELHFIVSDEVEQELHSSFDGGVNGGPPLLPLRCMIVRCIHSSDLALHPGMLGFIDFIDGNGVLHCICSEGDRIELIPGEDQYEICERTVNNVWRRIPANKVSGINLDGKHVVELKRTHSGFEQVYVPNVGSFTFTFHGTH